MKNKKCVIYQNNKFKLLWDLIIIFLLLFVCIVIPWRIAFVKNEPYTTKQIFILIDALFAIDIILTFFTTTENNKTNEENTSHKVIAKEYFECWFWIDLISIFPFDEVSNLILYENSNEKQYKNTAYMLKAVRITKISKLIRLMRLVKLLKLMKNSEKLKVIAGKQLEISAGLERLGICFM